MIPEEMKKVNTDLIKPKPKPKDPSITVEITDYEYGNPIPGLTLDDFELTSEGGNRHLFEVEKMKPSEYYKEIKLYECESVVCNMPKMEG